MKVICFGPGPHFKGGISDYNVSLAKSFYESKDCESVEIVSWTQQYPAIIPRDFKDRVSKTDKIGDSNIKCTYLTNYNNPITWKKTAKYIAKQKPDKVVFQWSISIQGLPLGALVKRLKRISNCEIIFDVHFVIQKERSLIDKILTKYAFKGVDKFIVHANKTYTELQELLPSRKFYIQNTARIEQKQGTPVLKLYHPVYNLFKPDENFNIKAFKEKHELKDYVFLFFGFIRKYKGLHNVFKAFQILSKERKDVSLLVCGQSFWNTLPKNSFSYRFKRGLFGLLNSLLGKKSDGEQNYNPIPLIKELGIEDNVKVFNRFIANEEVHTFFQASNFAVLFYSRATPSGIESLSYNFNLPILATPVGHFPESIQDGKNGFLAKENTVDSMAETMKQAIKSPIPTVNIEKIKEVFSWENYAHTILKSS